MFTNLEQLTTNFLEILSGVDPVKGFLFVIFFLVVSFLPSVVAFFFNRKNFAKIFAANVPALLSFVAWFAVLAWALTGKVWEKKNDKEAGAA